MRLLCNYGNSVLEMQHFGIHACGHADGVAWLGFSKRSGDGGGRGDGEHSRGMLALSGSEQLEERKQECGAEQRAVEQVSRGAAIPRDANRGVRCCQAIRGFASRRSANNRGLATPTGALTERCRERRAFD